MLPLPPVLTGSDRYRVLYCKRVMTWMFAGVRVAFYLSAWKFVPSVSRIEPNKPEEIIIIIIIIKDWTAITVYTLTVGKIVCSKLRTCWTRVLI